jgi:hypothetical protein
MLHLSLGTNSSGHLSQTIYDCHLKTSHHQALKGEETTSRAFFAAHHTASFVEFHASLID